MLLQLLVAAQDRTESLLKSLFDGIPGNAGQERQISTFVANPVGRLNTVGVNMKPNSGSTSEADCKVLCRYDVGLCYSQEPIICDRLSVLGYAGGC
jgi:hypothetical protein